MSTIDQAPHQLSGIRVLRSALPSAAKLFVIDGLQPEDSAMLQALYSRSADSVEHHLEKLAKTGSGKFMESYYVGYNHKSIADCGDTTMFIENVSMLAAKAIEDWPLYSGQETSTRYINMSEQPVVDPVGSSRSGLLLSELMTFYDRNQDRVADEVRRRYPRRDGEDEAVYERAVKARRFDILRGFLPAGICTQLSWHTNLRQAGDHLSLLLYHPTSEVREVATELAKMLAKQYPSSIGIGKQAAVSAVVGGSDERAAWLESTIRKYSYDQTPFVPKNYWNFDSTIDWYRMLAYEEMLKTRPRGAVLPHFLSDLGQLEFRFLLDFGSFRDIQRHRNGVCRMPLLTTDHGFESWYLDQLDDELRREATNLIVSLTDAIGQAVADPILRQYYIPMGFEVACQVTYGLPAAVYVAELRTSKTVHPTLRRVAQWMASCIANNYPIAIHSDLDADDWTIRRGKHTITAKESH
jgi:thymidylate synthase ThyX